MPNTLKNVKLSSGYREAIEHYPKQERGVNTTDLRSRTNLLDLEIAVSETVNLDK
jgi:hypothetical protein